VADAALEVLKLRLAGRDTQAAHLLKNPQLHVQVDAVLAEAHHRRRGVELGHQPRRLAGRSAGEVALVQQNDIRPPGLRQVVRDAAPRDPASDNDDPGLIDHG
jgi:hypothetical protein